MLYCCLSSETYTVDSETWSWSIWIVEIVVDCSQLFSLYRLISDTSSNKTVETARTSHFSTFLLDDAASIDFH